MENKSFYDKVYEAVMRIPRGKVATYGQVAARAGNGAAARIICFARPITSLPFR